MQIPPDKAQLLDVTGISGNIRSFGHVFSPNPRCRWCCQFNGRPDLLLSDDLCHHSFYPVSYPILSNPNPPKLYSLSLPYRNCLEGHDKGIHFLFPCIKPTYSVLGMKELSHPTRKSLKTGGHPVWWPWCLTMTSVQWPTCSLMG